MNTSDAQYRGVKGWLLLLCVSLTILDPFSAFFTIIMVTNATKPYFDQYPGLLRLVLIGGICSTCMVVFSVYAGLSLWRVVPKAVTIAKRYLMTAFLYSLFAMFLPSMVGLSGGTDMEIAQTGTFNNFIVMVYVSLWYFYLLRSKRVKATYGETEDSKIQ